MIVCEDGDTGDLYLRDAALYDGTEEGRRVGGVLEDATLWDRYMEACRAVGAAKAAIANSLRPITDEDLAAARNSEKAGGR